MEVRGVQERMEWIHCIDEKVLQLGFLFFFSCLLACFLLFFVFYRILIFNGDGGAMTKTQLEKFNFSCKFFNSIRQKRRRRVSTWARKEFLPLWITTTTCFCFASCGTTRTSMWLYNATFNEMLNYCLKNDIR